MKTGRACDAAAPLEVLHNAVQFGAQIGRGALVSLDDHGPDHRADLAQLLLQLVDLVGEVRVRQALSETPGTSQQREPQGADPGVQLLADPPALSVGGGRRVVPRGLGPPGRNPRAAPVPGASVVHITCVFPSTNLEHGTSHRRGNSTMPHMVDMTWITRSHSSARQGNVTRSGSAALKASRHGDVWRLAPPRADAPAMSVESRRVARK